MNKKFIKKQHCFVVWVFHHLGFGDKSIIKINQALGNDDEELKSFGNFVWKIALFEMLILPFVLWFVVQTGVNK